jgi:predicted pyridoxine 5'-phosphate oxidase superfamily flavin-nucleotide-binding protein
LADNHQPRPRPLYRGGPPGFLHVLDDKTIAFADFVGTRQYITIGNLADNPKVHLFLIDYAQQHRIKIWGEGRVVEGDAQLMPRDYKARAGQVILITVSAWDANCPQHIPQRFDAADVLPRLWSETSGSPRSRLKSEHCNSQRKPPNRPKQIALPR